MYGDSILIIYQVKGKWQTKDEKLKPCQKYLSKLAEEFEEIKFINLGSQLANVLATLASLVRIDFGHKVQLIHMDIKNNPTHCCPVKIVGNPWYYNIKLFLQNQAYPMGASKIDKKTLRRLAMDFYLDGEIFQKKSTDGTLLRCLDEVEAKDTLLIFEIY